MSWSNLHAISEQLASEAGVLVRLGNLELAVARYADAALAEEKALAELGSDKPRTFGITGVSAVSLWLKAREYQRAERLARHVLANSIVPDFARRDLQSLLREISKNQVEVASAEDTKASFRAGAKVR